MSTSVSTRVNLSIPMEMAIRVERIADKKNSSRTQFIKEAIQEKIENMEQLKNSQENLGKTLGCLKEEIVEIKIAIYELRDAVRK